MARRVISPNKQLQRARLACPSPSRTGHRMSCAELARQANSLLHGKGILDADMDAGYISKLEAGEYRWPRSPHRRWALRTALKVETDAEIGLYPDRFSRHDCHAQSAASASLAIVKSGQSQALPNLAQGGAAASLEWARVPFGSWPDSEEMLDVSSSDSSAFLTLTKLLASQRQAVAPDVLLSLVEAHRECLAMLFRKASSDPLRVEIGILLGETSIVASRLCSAKGNRALAVAHCAYARRMADKLNDPVLGAISRIFESNLHSEAATLIGADGDILTGLRLLDEAAAVGDLLNPAAQARIAAEQAQSYAALHLRRECEDALSRARDAAGRIKEADRTGLFSDWSLPRVQVYEGTCSLFLDDSKKAVHVLTEALRDADSDKGNVNVSLAASVDLASAYVDSGELGEGCKMLADTYRRLSDIGNRRGIQRALGARTRLDRWNDEQHVRELDEIIRAHDEMKSSNR